MADKTLHQYGKTKLLPKTGQTSSAYDYDDGYFEKGNPVSPRFVGNADNTVSDRATGLTWINDVAILVPWLTDTGSYAGGYAYDVGDLINTTISIHSYYNFAYVCTTQHTSPFVATWQPYTYYAAGSFVYNPYGGDILGCTTSHTSTNDFNDDYYNQGWWSTTGYYSGDEFMLDIGYWQGNPWTANGMYGSTPAVGTATQFPIVDLLNYTAGLTYNGYSDWRVPNINELWSIFNWQGDSLCAYSEFTELTNDHYWSSTNSTADFANTFWGIYFSQYSNPLFSLSAGSIYKHILVRGG